MHVSLQALSGASRRHDRGCAASLFRAGGDTHKQGAREKETYDEEERRKARREFFQFPRKISLSRSEYVSEQVYFHQQRKDETK